MLFQFYCIYHYFDLKHQIVKNITSNKMALLDDRINIYLIFLLEAEQIQLHKHVN